MKKKSTFIKDWEDTRKIGRIKYALLHGSIFGIIVGTFTVLVSNYASNIPIESGDELLLNTLVFVGGGIAGYFILIWPINEYFYKRYIDKYLPSKKKDK